MADELFKRFRATPQSVTPPGGASERPLSVNASASAVEDEDSGQAYRTGRATAAGLDEAEVMTAIERIPALPKVVQELLSTVGRDGSSIAAIDALMQQDMVLAGRLLNLVNSPFYALSRPVGSISQAVAIIGFASLKSLVLAASTAGMFTVDLGVYGFLPSGLWQNSIATAAIARAIAQRAKLSADAAEEYFAAGLLRDVGMLVLAPFLSRRGLTLQRRAGGSRDILHQERELIGYDHCWVGERLAGKWRLPTALSLCMASHHRIPLNVPANSMRQLAGVRLAERLAYNAGIGVRKDHPFDSHLDGVLLQAAGIDAAGLEHLVKQMPTIIKAAEIPL